MNLDDSIIPRPNREIDDALGVPQAVVEQRPTILELEERLHGGEQFELTPAGEVLSKTPNIDSLNAIDAILQEPELPPKLIQQATDIRHGFEELVADANERFPEPAPLPFPRVHPFGSRVLVKPDDAPQNYDAAGLIQRTDQARERPQEGTIVRTGLALKPIDETKLQHVRIGQRVMYGMYSGSDVYVDDVGYIMLDVEDLLGEVEGEGPATVRKTWEKPAEPKLIIPVERDSRIIIP